MRKIKTIGLCFIAVLTVATTAFGQLSKGGRPYTFENILSAAQMVISARQLPSIDVAAYKLQDSIDASNKDIPYRFGAPMAVNYTLDNSGTWETLANGDRLWRLKISSPGAYSLNLVYDHFYLPEGGKLYIYNGDGSYVIGAFTSDNNKKHGRFATAPVKGDVSVLEYYEPKDVTGQGIISISSVVHAYRNLFDRDELKAATDFGSSGSCNNNVNCPEGDPWQAEKRAVAMILTAGNSRICSGSLINNVREDQTPYFLTANHCLPGSDTWIFMFNYESPNCSNINGPTYMTLQGSTLRATYSTSDFCLLELDEAPPDSYNVYYAGWSADNVASTSSTCIHHPKGDIKKISFDYDPATSANYLSTSGTTHWRIGSWDDGTTEGGSSGSPLFDQNHHIVGQLHGGYASCTDISSDWFGKFAMSWNGGGSSSTRLRDWLDPDNTSTTILDGLDPFAGTDITHTPLPNTSDTTNDYAVYATITSNDPLVADSLLLYYQIASVWYEDTLEATGQPDEFLGYIPAQPPGTIINYYLYATNTSGVPNTTETYSFEVLDYGLSITAAVDSGFAITYDTVWFDLTLANDGVFDDSYTLQVTGGTWPVSIWDQAGATQISSTGTIVSGNTFDFKAAVEVQGTIYGNSDIAEITGTSVADNSVTGSINLKAISEGQPVTLPFTDNFPTQTLDPSKWVYKSSGSNINDAGANEPSAPYSLDFDGDPGGADTVVSQVMDLSGLSDARISFYYEPGGSAEAPDVNDNLYFEYRNSSGGWAPLQTYYGDGSIATTYYEEVMTLPPDALHSSFRLRIRNTATPGNFDDWFVDDIFIGEPPAYAAKVTPSSQGQYGAAGDSALFRIKIFNRGMYDDVYDLSASGGLWAAAFFDSIGMTQIFSTPTISAGDSAGFVVKVAVPAVADLAEGDTSMVTITSQGDAGVSATCEIRSYSSGPTGAFPWYEPFPEDTLYSMRWIINKGADVTGVAPNPPSSPYALKLDGGNDTIVSQIIDLSGKDGALLTYYYEPGGGGDAPDAGEYLRVDYRNVKGIWITIDTLEGNGATSTSFTKVTIPLPIWAIHSNFQLRFRSTGTCVDCDIWYVDDINIGYIPAIEVQPAIMSKTMVQGDSASEQLVISNTGEGELDYNLSILPLLNKSARLSDLLADSLLEPAQRVYPEGFDEYEDIKGVDDPRDGYPVDKSAGGPDGSGYYWIDSDQLGGPTFSWEDITSTGTLVTGLDDDNYVGPYGIGFGFTYYGTTYNSLYIGSNGLIGFSPTDLDVRAKKSIPTDTTPNNFLAWMWDDLDPTNANNPGSQVFMYNDASHCVIQFVNYPEYGAAAGDIINAEIILFDDGTVKFQYLTIAPGFDIASSTIGIENATGTDGLEVAYLTPYLKNNLAIQFYHPDIWMSSSKASGEIQPAEADTVEIKIMSAGMDEGTYHAQIAINSNDPDPGDNPFVIPVELTVLTLPQFVCGDANNDEEVNLLDILYLIANIYGDPAGPPPDPPESGDVNNDGSVNLLDILFLISYKYDTPPGPSPQCP